MGNVLFDSRYYTFWFEHVELTSKGHVDRELRKFEKFLLMKGFEGELDFDRFHASHKHQGVFRPIQEYFIDQFVEYLRVDYQATKNVLYNAISSLKNFFKFLYEMELIQHNPMDGYPNPYYDRPIKNTALSKEECLALLRVAVKRDPFFRQDFILLWLMLITGLRNSETRYLSLKNINLDSRMVIVTEKQKGDARSTSITTALSEELKRYTNHPSYLAWVEEGNKTLFFRNEEALTDKALRKFVKNLCLEANLSRTVTPHDIRRTAGYLMQTAGMNIVEIQRQLGHKDKATTFRYLPPLEDLAKILNEMEDEDSLSPQT
jgi:integrase/recombinase XerD